MTVNDYLDNLPEGQKKLLSSMRKSIRETCPRADEIFSYHMPGYKYLGKPLFYFAAFKDHCSLFGISKKMFIEFKKDLSAFKIVGSTLRVDVKRPLSDTLLKQLISSKMKEIISHQV
jgi:uncharacterized protein YdhG (YjbR/CyaY superfamily)